ncbi:MAG: hypothetical protein DBX59_02015 [Bacillota bacterium]|nr:MAG: hypothetical protein DBX59_02015 [Bacillota bacterium]
MKTIGFVDYYIDEWHANNYPAWIDEVCKKLGKDYKVAYAWAEVDKSPEGGEPDTAAWCAKFGVQRCETLKELCEKSDYILVLAPSNPEKHLGYAEEVLKYGKRTYIDKTFAPDFATAKKIFDLSEKYNAPFFSSSALRYADELKDARAQSVMTTGGGRSLEEYIIHQTEMVVKLLGTGAARARVDASGRQYICRVEYADGRAASMVYADGLPFTVYTEQADGGCAYLPISSDFFKNLIADIVNFYETGERSFCGKQTLEVMKVREAVICGKDKLGEWIDIG